MATAKKSLMDDVAQPGKTPASATSRPIIVGHGPALKDPMVNEDKPAATNDPTASAQADTSVAPSTAKKVIQPLGTDEASNSTTKEHSTDSAEPVIEKPETTDTSVTDEAVVDAVIDQVADKKKIAKEEEEQRKRHQNIEKLVAEKKYFVPIGKVQRRRNNRIAFTVVFLLLLLGGAILALDAGLVETNVTLPFDLIK